MPTRGMAQRRRLALTGLTQPRPLPPLRTPLRTMTAGPTRVTAQVPMLARAMTVPARAMTAGPTKTAGTPDRHTRGRTSRVTPRTVTRAGATRSRPIRRRVTRTSATRSRPIRSRPIRSRPIRSRPIRNRVPGRSRGTKNTVTRVLPARDRRLPGATRDPGTRTRATRLTETSAIRSRATRRPVPRVTRIRGTPSTGIPGRPRATPSHIRTRATAPSATAGRSRPTGAVVSSTRTRRPPRASRPSRPSPTKQIRPRAGNRGGAAGVTRYQPVRLCPPGRTYCLRGIPFGWSRVAPFAERRPPHRST